MGKIIKFGITFIMFIFSLLAVNLLFGFMVQFLWEHGATEPDTPI